MAPKTLLGCSYKSLLLVIIWPCNVYLDNILLHTSSIAEHRPLISRQPSVDSASTAQLNQNPYKLEVGSTIEYGKPVEYGVIKWIGMLPGRESVLYAGVEMVSDIETLYVHYTICHLKVLLLNQINVRMFAFL